MNFSGKGPQKQIAPNAFQTIKFCSDDEMSSSYASLIPQIAFDKLWGTICINHNINFPRPIQHFSTLALLSRFYVKSYHLEFGVNFYYNVGEI